LTPNKLANQRAALLPRGRLSILPITTFLITELRAFVNPDLRISQKARL